MTISKNIITGIRMAMLAYEPTGHYEYYTQYPMVIARMARNMGYPNSYAWIKDNLELYTKIFVTQELKIKDMPAYGVKMKAKKAKPTQVKGWVDISNIFNKNSEAYRIAVIFSYFRNNKVSLETVNSYYKDTFQIEVEGSSTALVAAILQDRGGLSHVVGTTQYIVY